MQAFLQVSEMNIYYMYTLLSVILQLVISVILKKKYIYIFLNVSTSWYKLS